MFNRHFAKIFCSFIAIIIVSMAVLITAGYYETQSDDGFAGRVPAGNPERR